MSKDETEIIRKVFERVVERLEEKIVDCEKISEDFSLSIKQSCFYGGKKIGFIIAKQIVKEECGIV